MLSHIKNTSLIALTILLAACGSSNNSVKDKDGDTVLDGLDNCILTPNINQIDTDNDGKGDECDLAINNPDLTYVELDRLIETKRITTIFEGTVGADRLGRENTFVNVGDINGDSKPDLAVVLTGEGTTNEYDDGTWTGTMHVHIILGGTPLPELVNKANIADIAATTIELAHIGGENKDPSHSVNNRYQVMAGGDLNNDGRQDIVILNAKSAAEPRGILYYVYGRDSWPKNIAEEDLADDYGFSITNSTAYNQSAKYQNISPAGDINGDGYQDVFVAYDADSQIYNELNTDDINNPYREFPPYILFGNTTGFSGALDLSTITDAQGTQIIDSNNQGKSSLGQRMVSLGNFNGDQYDDFAILDGHYRSEGVEGDYLYIVYGKQQWPAQTDLAHLTLQADPATPTQPSGFIISGVIDSANDVYHRFINARFAANADLNGDGLNDMFIAMNGRQDGSDQPLDFGWNIILWGGQTFSQLNTNSLTHADALDVYLPDSRKRFNGFPSFIPDINTDGSAELLYGVPKFDSTNLYNGVPDVNDRTEGGVYVIHGSAPLFHDDLDFTNLQPKHGFFIHDSEGGGLGLGKVVGSLGNWNDTGNHQSIFFTQPIYHPDEESEATDHGRVFVMTLSENLYEVQ